MSKFVESTFPLWSPSLGTEPTVWGGCLVHRGCSGGHLGPLPGILLGPEWQVPLPGRSRPAMGSGAPHVPGITAPAPHLCCSHCSRLQRRGVQSWAVSAGDPYLLPASSAQCRRLCILSVSTALGVHPAVPAGRIGGG